LFGRSKHEAQPVETPVKDGGKGRPTPSRKEAEAAAKALAKTPRTRKEQAAAQRLARGSSSREVREGMKAGDERFLMARDKGPVRRFIRDYVDTKWRAGDYVLPFMLVALMVGFVGGRDVAIGINFLVLVLMLMGIVSTVFLRFSVRRELRRRFPDESLKGTTYYAAIRAIQMRFMRIPKAQVKIGQQLPDTYR
jgi:hypothetical protein